VPAAPPAADDAAPGSKAIPEEPTSPKVPPPAQLPEEAGRFQFGSYGRVMAGMDARGRRGRDADIVAHGSRLDEDTYAELELRRVDTWTPPGDKSPVSTLIVTTLAIGEPLFHTSGKFDAKLAVRNLYLEERGIGDKAISVWVGSRMYRGDDAYLLNWWPLDNLNTVGGGVRLNLPSRTEIAIHAGINRLDDPAFTQSATRALPHNQLGTTQVEILDRPKFIESFRVEQIVPALTDKGGLKFVAYSELHQVASGQREREPGRYQDLPSDSGWVAGAQVGAFTGERDTHLNLFFRYARGLAAYGEFGVPYAISNDRTSKGAHEAIVALSGNYEHGPFAVMLAAYFRSFRVASVEQFSYSNIDEGILVVRPQIWFGERAGVFVEGSYQKQQRGILDETGSKPVDGSLQRIGVVPFLSPAGRGSYRRPQLRAIWLATRRDDGARSLYPADDPFARRKIEHFIGLEAEWWFNSSYR
jgi:hypothetical protein